MKKKIDMDIYARRETFRAFLNREVPLLSVTCELDITPLHAFHKAHGLRFFPLLAFLIDKTMNQVGEFRHRIIDGELFEFGEIHPSFTVLRGDNTISFCDMQRMADIGQFYEQVVAVSDHAIKNANLEMRDKHDRYFISNIPWLRFTAFTHPYSARYASIPIVTTGKYTHVGERVVMPVALQAHHGLVDGYHLGEFYRLMERNLAETDELLGG